MDRQVCRTLEIHAMSTTSDTTDLFSMGIGFESPRNFDYVSAFKDTQGIRVSGEYAELEQPINRIDFYLKGDIGIGPHNVELPEGLSSMPA